MLEERDFSEVMASKLASVGIDVCKGITYTGSEDKYIKALQTFCSVYAVHSKALVEKCEALRRNGPEEQVVALLTNEAHALKGNARMIGAEALGNLAESLEFKGRASNLGGILKETGPLLAEYERVVKAVSEYVQGHYSPTSCSGTQDNCTELLDALLVALGEFDDDLAANLTHKLMGIADEALQEDLAKLDELIDDFLYDEAEELTRSIREKSVR